jgi:hypothetical protein
MTKEIVIAAYDKNLDWLNILNSDIKRTVYRKGSALPLAENEILIESNIGRCIHTFFNHIVRNYNNLSDYTYFAQDYPFDHWGNLVEIINNQTDVLLNETSTVNIKNGYYGYCINEIGQYHTIPSIVSSKSVHHNGDILISICGSHFHDIRLNDYWDILFNSSTPSFYEFNPGGHFVVTKERVLNRSKTFYEKIVEILENDDIAPWNFERLECYIFNPNYISKI